MNRKFHRWVSFPVAIFMFVIAVTGLILQLEELGEKEQPKPAVQASAPRRPDMTALLTQAVAAADKAKPDFKASKAEVNWADGKPVVTFSEGNGRMVPTIRYDATAGTAEYKPAPPKSLHVLMIGIHTGKMAGMPGMLLSLATGLILIILCITGLYVYVDMWRRRNKAGKTGLFWS